MCELKKYPFYVTSSCGETAVIRLPDDVFIIAGWCMRTGRESAFTIPKCSFYFAKLMQGESNSKTGKQSLTRLDTAEPQLSFYKGNANERRVSLLTLSRVQLTLCKDNAKIRFCPIKTTN
ncbi:unknown [Prevotella sp. CAG:487]|nr:unknown [Prevotella sp. CAG:487]